MLHLDTWKDLINERSLQRAAADLFRHSRVLRSVEDVKRSVDDQATRHSSASMQDFAMSSRIVDSSWPTYDQWKFTTLQEPTTIECSLSPEKLTVKTPVKTPVPYEASGEFNVHRAIVQSRWAKLSQLFLLIRIDDISEPSRASPETRPTGLPALAEEDEGYHAIKRDASPFSDLCEHSDLSSDDGQGAGNQQGAAAAPPWTETATGFAEQPCHARQDQDARGRNSTSDDEQERGWPGAGRTSQVEVDRVGGAGGRYRDMAESVEGSIIQKDLSSEGNELHVTFEPWTPRKQDALRTYPPNRPEPARPSSRPCSASEVRSSWKVELNDGRGQGGQGAAASRSSGDRKADKGKVSGGS